MDKTIRDKIDADYAAYNRLGTVDLAPIYRRKTEKDSEGVGKQAMIEAIVATLYSRKYIEEYNALHAPKSEAPVNEEKIMASKKPVKTVAPVKSVKKVEAPVKASPELKKAMTIPQGIKAGKKVTESAKKFPTEGKTIAFEPKESLKKVEAAIVKTGIKVEMEHPGDHIVRFGKDGVAVKVSREEGERLLHEAIYRKKPEPVVEVTAGRKVISVGAENHPCWCIRSGCSNMVGNMVSRCPANCKGDGSTPCVHPSCTRKACPSPAENIIELPEPVVETMEIGLKGKKVAIKKSAPVKEAAPVCRRCNKLLKDDGQEFCGLCRNAIRMMSAENRAQWIAPEPVVVKAKKAIASAVAPAAKASKPSKSAKKPVKSVKKPIKPLSTPKKKSKR